MTKLGNLVLLQIACIVLLELYCYRLSVLTKNIIKCNTVQMKHVSNPFAQVTNQIAVLAGLIGQHRLEGCCLSHPKLEGYCFPHPKLAASFWVGIPSQSKWSQFEIDVLYSINTQLYRFYNEAIKYLSCVRIGTLPLVSVSRPNPLAQIWSTHTDLGCGDVSLNLTSLVPKE